MIKVCAFSDSFGYLPSLETCDLVLISGNIIPLDKIVSITDSINWLKSTFRDWVKSLPLNTKIVLIFGSKEVGIECLPKDGINAIIASINEVVRDKIICLQDDSYTFQKYGTTLTIYGTSYSKTFNGWAFIENSCDLKERYANIPENCDFLLTTDIPYGITDVCENIKGDQFHIGNNVLRDAIINKSPKICVHGNIEATNRSDEFLDNTRVCGVNLSDKNFNITYSPVYFEV